MINQELIKRARKIAEKKHPEGFNKKQLIEASKEVFGGRGKSGGKVYTKIKNQKDIENQRNSMALIDGHYPLSMTGCEVVGINGDCGIECPVFNDGDCDGDDLGDFLDEIIEKGNLDEIKGLYPDIKKFQNQKQQ